MLLLTVIVQPKIRRKQVSYRNLPQNTWPAEYPPENSIGLPNGRENSAVGLFVLQITTVCAN